MRKTSKGRYFLCGALMVGVMMLTGCGEEPYELEDSEREVIVNYTAHIIAKYNVKQPEGYRYVYVTEEEETEPIENEQEPELETAEAEEPETEETASEETYSSEKSENEEESNVTLSEALGLTDVAAIYTGAELTDHYESVVPDSGNRLMILHVTLQNQGDEAVECDLLSGLPTFKARVNDAEDTTAEITILPENLSTYQDVIPAKSSVDTIIMFQLKNADITSIEQLEMYVTANQNTKKVIFL